MNKPINNFRRSIGINGKYKNQDIPSIYGISSYFLPKPKDYPENCFFTGFWFEDSTVELDHGILDFFNAGERPLLFTLGSMPFRTTIDLPKVLNRITKELKTRIIVVKGWGLNDMTQLEKNENIRVIDGAPYDKLIPHIRAAIHHGGIGTSAECMRAGKPFLTCPVLYPLGDQHFWGTIAYKKGIGLKPLPLKNMNEESFVKSVKELIQNKKLYDNSWKMMEKLKKEDGVSNAVQIIESL